MSKKGILLAITNGVWLIHEGAVQAFSQQISDVLKSAFNNDGKPEASAFWSGFDKSKPEYLLQEKVLLIGADRAPYYAKDLNLSNATEGSILMLSMDGPLMKHDNCGDPGALTYEMILSRAKANNNISAVIMNMDGPGGTVDGTESLANVLSSIGKPVVTFTNGMICSAHYWLAANTNYIIAASNTCQIGSISVCSTFWDYSKMWEEMGVKEHYIVAKGSEDKNRAYYEARKGNYDAYKEQILNPLREQFVAAVDKNRGSKFNLAKENVMSGKVYIASEAVKVGLIDQVGDLESAIDKAFEL